MVCAEKVRLMTMQIDWFRLPWFKLSIQRTVKSILPKVFHRNLFSKTNEPRHGDDNNLFSFITVLKVVSTPPPIQHPFSGRFGGKRFHNP